MWAKFYFEGGFRPPLSSLHMPGSGLRKLAKKHLVEKRIIYIFELPIRCLAEHVLFLYDLISKPFSREGPFCSVGVGRSEEKQAKQATDGFSRNGSMAFVFAAASLALTQSGLDSRKK